MSAFARIASEIFPEEAPAPAKPIGKVIAVSRHGVTAAVPRSEADDMPLYPGTPVAVGDHDSAWGTLTTVDALMPATDPSPDDIFMVEVSIFPGADMRAVGIGSSLRLVTAAERHALHSEGVVSPLPIGEADWGDGVVPYLLDAQSLLGTHTILSGAHGSGKSCTLAVIFRSLLRTRFSGRLVLIDPLGGFAHSFGGGADITDTEEALIPFGMMAPEHVAAALDVASAPLMPEELALLRGLMRRSDIHAQNFRGQSSVSPSLSSVIDACHHRADSSDARDPARGLAVKLSTAARDPRLRAFFGEAASSLTAADVLQNLFRLPDGRPPMSVLQLGGFDPQVRPIAAAAILHLTRQFSAMAGEQIPLMVGIDSVDGLCEADKGVFEEILSKSLLPGLGLVVDVRDEQDLPETFREKTALLMHHQPAGLPVEVTCRSQPFTDHVMISRLKDQACPHAATLRQGAMPPSREDLLTAILEAWQGGSAP